MTKLSFVIPVYNGEAWVAEAIQSCLRQTHKDIEVVVVDDKSEDSTPVVLDHFKKLDNRVKVITNELNKGSGASRNVGCAAATGDILAVLDADDVSDDHRAKATVNAFKDGGNFYFHGGAAIVDANLGALSTHIPQPFNIAHAIDSLQCGIVHSTAAFTKKLWVDYPFDEDEFVALGMEDWNQQMRLALDGVEIKSTPAVLAAYRAMSGSQSRWRDEEKVRKVKLAFLDARGAKNVTA